jgi:hypothetical protein
LPPPIWERQYNRQVADPLDGLLFRQLPARSMAHLNAIAATSTVRFWWRSSTLAARWRD